MKPLKCTLSDMPDARRAELVNIFDAFEIPYVVRPACAIPKKIEKYKCIVHTIE